MCLNATLTGEPIHHLNNKYVVNLILVLHLYVRANVCPFASGKGSTWAGQSMKEKDEPLRGGSPELGIAKQVLKVIKYSQKVGVRDSKRTQQHVHKWSRFKSSLVSQISGLLNHDLVFIFGLLSAQTALIQNDQTSTDIELALGLQQFLE